MHKRRRLMSEGALPHDNYILETRETLEYVNFRAYSHNIIKPSKDLEFFYLLKTVYQ